MCTYAQNTLAIYACMYLAIGIGVYMYIYIYIQNMSSRGPFSIGIMGARHRKYRPELSVGDDLLAIYSGWLAIPWVHRVTRMEVVEVST